MNKTDHSALRQSKKTMTVLKSGNAQGHYCFQNPGLRVERQWEEATFRARSANVVDDSQETKNELDDNQPHPK